MLLLVTLSLLIAPLLTAEDIVGCYGSSYIYNKAGGPYNIKVQIPNRPAAFGRFNFRNNNRGTVDFTDDQKYKLTFDPLTGVIDWDGLERPWSGDKRREWDEENHWQKDTPDIAGQYNHISDNNKQCDLDVYRTVGNKIEIDWSNCNGRPLASGYVNCPTGAGQPFSGAVTFPDDKTYSLAYFPDEGKIYWDGVTGPDDTNNIWVRHPSANSHTQYVAGYYFDPFVLWEIQEMKELFNGKEEIGQMKSIIMNDMRILFGSGVVLIIIIISVLYFGYKRKTGKGNYEALN